MHTVSHPRNGGKGYPVWFRSDVIKLVRLKMDQNNNPSEHPRSQIYQEVAQRKDISTRTVSSWWNEYQHSSSSNASSSAITVPSISPPPPPSHSHSRSIDRDDTNRPSKRIRLDSVVAPDIELNVIMYKFAYPSCLREDVITFIMITFGVILSKYQMKLYLELKKHLRGIWQ